MRTLFFLAAFCLSFCLVDALIPKIYGSVSQDDLSAGSISGDKLKSNIIGKEHLRDFSVTNQKLASYSISDRNLQNNAVTSRSLAVDFVHISIPINFNPYNYEISNPTGKVTIVPFHPHNFNQQYYVTENFEDISLNNLFNSYIFPSPDYRYVASARAAGTGVILGWYPAQNGHLLRYQADRALKYLECATAYDFFYGSFVYAQCLNNLGNLGNNEAGVPIYSPSVERVEIDQSGYVRVFFFGAGVHDGVTRGYANGLNYLYYLNYYDANNSDAITIDITVAVLLDNQFGQ